MHTVINLRGSIHVFIHITDGRCHDSNVLDILVVVPNAIYTMDKAYIDFEALARIDAEKAYFVTRAKDNMKYEIVSSHYNIDTSTGLLEDHRIRLTGIKFGNQDANQRIDLDQERSEGPRNRATTAHYKSGCQ